VSECKTFEECTPIAYEKCDGKYWVFGKKGHGMRCCPKDWQESSETWSDANWDITRKETVKEDHSLP
jgi:hypothetical protein